MTELSERVPSDLVGAIREGRCVAFVGAGFSAPSKPSWTDTLVRLAHEIEDQPKRASILAWLGGPQGAKLPSRDLEGIAATIHEYLGDKFSAAMRKVLEPDRPMLDSTRLDQLLGIPFHAILTTNFDGVLSGTGMPTADDYARVLTRPRRSWWNRDWWEERGHEIPILNVHGCLKRGEQIVFTTHQYRTLIHETPGYRGFLRALFTTHTILYLGFSFTDAYINETRSEMLAMLGLDQIGRGGADFAVLDNVSPIVETHLREREGLITLNYRTSGSVHSGFDDWLRDIHAATSPEATLSAVTRARRILWFDPVPSNNDYGYRVLSGATGPSHESLIDRVETLDEALNRLESNQGSRADSSARAPRYDLVISHYGHQDQGPPNLERLILEMRARDLRAPVLAFSSGAFRQANRLRALELGALGYTDTWAELFETLERCFTDDRRER